ncbi:MAG: magnesium transporter [candidate division Zixibacteria bacterium SM23_81]|nr:MAG: magnesium transporter [candidate division Zixibacteria bacterium SM23_81]
MSRLTKRMSHKAGLPPGSLVHIGKRKVEKTRITLMDYDERQFQEKEAKTIEECFPFKDTPTVTWVNIDGVHDVDIVEKIGRHFGIHPLVLEDIVNTRQRPKMEDFEDYIFIVLKMITYDEKTSEMYSEQVSMILGKNFVISFQERQGDVFDPIRDRIRNSKGRIRKAGSDYLAYTLLDAIVDGYFFVLENLGERIEILEDEVIENPTSETLQVINSLKREMILLRRSVWPLREVIGALDRSGSSLIHESTGTYLRDVYDHTIQVADTIESFRDMITGTRDTYLSSLSNRMNEVMKVLTIIATIFIPVTFIAGIYGMNFEFMPELGWRWSYFIVWGVMVAVAVTMIAYFRRKTWL